MAGPSSLALGLGFTYVAEGFGATDPDADAEPEETARGRALLATGATADDGVVAGFAELLAEALALATTEGVALMVVLATTLVVALAGDDAATAAGRFVVLAGAFGRVTTNPTPAALASRATPTTTGSARERPRAGSTMVTAPTVTCTSFGTVVMTCAERGGVGRGAGRGRARHGIGADAVERRLSEGCSPMSTGGMPNAARGAT